MNFHKVGNGYAARTNPTRSYLHHLVAGKPAKGYFVDHVNRDRLDNRKSNLRIVTIKQSSYNTAGRKGAKSTYKGVWFSSQKKKWVSTIVVDGTSKHVGTFSDETEAAKAYDREAKRYWGDYAYLNFPDLL